MPGIASTPYLIDSEAQNTINGVIKNTMKMDNVWSVEDSMGMPLGTRKYTIICFCPSLTFFYGQGGYGYIPTTTKMGGLSCFQTDNVNYSTSFSTLFFRIAESYSMSTVYSAEGESVSTNCGVWASDVNFTFIAQKIGIAGVQYIGECPASSFVSESGADAEFTV